MNFVFLLATFIIIIIICGFLVKDSFLSSQDKLEKLKFNQCGKEGMEDSGMA